MKTLRPQMSRGATVLNMSPMGSPLGSSIWGGSGTFKWWSLLHADWVMSKFHLVVNLGLWIKGRESPALPLFGSYLTVLPTHVCFPHHANCRDAV